MSTEFAREIADHGAIKAIQNESKQGRG
jgi:hypothetical protein